MDPWIPVYGWLFIWTDSKLQWTVGFHRGCFGLHTIYQRMGPDNWVATDTISSPYVRIAMSYEGVYRLVGSNPSNMVVVYQNNGSQWTAAAVLTVQYPTERGSSLELTHLAISGNGTVILAVYQYYSPYVRYDKTLFAAIWQYIGTAWVSQPNMNIGVNVQVHDVCLDRLGTTMAISTNIVLTSYRYTNGQWVPISIPNQPGAHEGCSLSRDAVYLANGDPYLEPNGACKVYINN